MSPDRSGAYGQQLGSKRRGRFAKKQLSLHEIIYHRNSTGETFKKM
jgi:hypothetical protein